MKRIVSYLFQGLILIAPLALTIFVVMQLINWVGELTNDIGIKVHPLMDPVIGIAGVVIILVLIGYLSSTLVFRPIILIIEQLITSTPLVKIIYTSIKDLFSAFVSDKKKFEHPVLIRMNDATGLQKLGFITEKDLSHIGLQDMVAVYLPHSYAFSGNLFIVPAANVTILENTSSTEIMKFIVSGGVTSIVDKHENH